MKREITFRPAFDRRHEDPKKNYGIHGVDMLWILEGKLGAVQFLVYTGWQLPHIKDSEPMAADLGYHSPKPRYEGHTPMSGECKHVKGGKCYYDGSGLNADRVLEILRREGSDGVWRELEEYYTETFGGLE